jgi:SAM-dependent methyltransferase
MTNKQFYDQLAPFYHLIHTDWEQSIQRHAAQLHQLIQIHWRTKTQTILDVACGIGTQALGLAQLGYQVTGSDLSDGEIARAHQEATKRGVHLSLSVADMQQAFDHHQQEFDLVIACDNAIPHLLSDAAIQATFAQLYHCVRPGGGLLISVRDYDNESRESPQVRPYGLRIENGKRYFIFQVWEFEGEIYEVSIYFIEDDRQANCQTHVMRGHYYAIGTTTLCQLITEAGFEQVQRLDEGYFQPVLIGHKPQG